MKLLKTIQYWPAIAGIMMFTYAGTANADPVRYMAMSKSVKAPIGHVQFCRENRKACTLQTAKPVVVKLTEARWNELVALNDAINKRIRPVTDMELYGREEYWTYPVGNAGDCEEYVLEKQRALLKAGWPSSTLLITVVKDTQNAGHAVLTVRTDQGDIVLDNQIAAVLPWYSTPYRFVKRQSPKNYAKWTGISDTRVAAVGAVRALN
ncbi:MAG: transglutaminase-like cysteine peptidase [Rhodobacteraceae bacterium]|nr:transglutaminase-like cysteine peptidase [Paracoccaceae bacterium]